MIIFKYSLRRVERNTRTFKNKIIRGLFENWSSHSKTVKCKYFIFRKLKFVIIVIARYSFKYVRIFLFVYRNPGRFTVIRFPRLLRFTLKYEFLLRVSVKFHIAHLYEVQGKYRLAKENYEALLKEKALPSHLKADICRQLGKSKANYPKDNRRPKPFSNPGLKKKKERKIHRLE